MRYNVANQQISGLRNCIISAPSHSTGRISAVSLAVMGATDLTTIIRPSPETDSLGESSWYVLKFDVFTAVTIKNAAFGDIKTQFLLHMRHITSPL
jgi:hypothetical protein